MKRRMISTGVWSLLTFISPLGGVGYGADDTSADAKGFASVLDQAPGVVMRVAIDSQGRENSASAQMRVASEPVSSEAQVQAAFDRGVDASTQAQVSPQDIAADSSTCGFYPYTYSYGWAPAYYYNTYTPTYYYSGYTYNYSTPVYYSNWGNQYRYYYYPRYYW